MNNLLFALFFGLGIAGFIYAKMGKRIGYGNSQNVWVVVGITFLIGTFLFYSLFTWIIHI